MRVKLITTLSEDFFSRWEALLQQSVLRNVQQYPVWVRAYISYYLNNRDWYFLTVMEDNGQMVSCLALQRDKRNIYWLFSYKRVLDLGSGVNDFFNIPCLPGYEDMSAKLLAEWLHNNKSFWSRLTFLFIPETNKMEQRLIQSLAKYYEVTVTRERSFYRIDTDREWSSYFTPAMNQKLRDVRGRLNRIERNGYKVSVQLITRGIDDYLHDFMLHFTERRRVKGEKNSYENEAKRKLLSEVLTDAETTGRAQLAILKDQHDAVWAYQLDLIDRKNGIWYHYAPAFNDQYKEFSPSKILLFETLKIAFADPDIKEFNFMRGEAEYKKQFTDDSEAYIGINVVNHLSTAVQVQRLIARIIGKQ